MLFQIEKLPITTTKHSRKRKVQSWKQLPFIFQSVLRLLPIILFIKFYIKLPYLLDEISKNVLLHTPISKISEYSYILSIIIYTMLLYYIIMKPTKIEILKRNKNEINIFLTCLLTHDVYWALAMCQVPRGQRGTLSPSPAGHEHTAQPASRQDSSPCWGLTFLSLQWLCQWRPRLPHNLPWQSVPRSPRVSAA